MLSDHFLVNINVSLQKQTVSATDISYRRYKSIDHLVDLYDSTLRDIVDEHAPLRRKEMPSRPMLPCYNKNK